MFTNRSSVSIKFICSLETCAPLKDITEGLKEIYSTLRLLHFHRLFIYIICGSGRISPIGQTHIEYGILVVMDSFFRVLRI